MQVKMRITGSYTKTFKYFSNGKKLTTKFKKICEEHGERAVNALSAATPKDTGETASRWKYIIEKWGLLITNDAQQDGVLTVVLLQYGHATRSGRFVQGEDFINPALKPIFNEIIKQWEQEIRSL